MPDTPAGSHEKLLDAVARGAREADVFERVEIAEGLLRAHARVVESDCWYQVGPVSTVDRATSVWVGIYTPDRWLSGSIEADVLNLGDKYEDLIEEELVDQGGEGRHKVEHFRDDEKVFVFRSPVTVREEVALDDATVADRVVKMLLAYEAAFRELGDMVPEED